MNLTMNAKEFSNEALTLIRITADAAGSEEIAELAEYTRSLQSQLEHLRAENKTLRGEVEDALKAAEKWYRERY